MVKMQFPTYSRRPLVVRALIGALVFGAFYVFLLPHRFKEGKEESGRPENDPAILPIEYYEPTNQSTYCQSHFGTLFLENMSKKGVEYCTPESTARLTCFNSITVPDHSRIDVICMGGPTMFEPQSSKFVLNCQSRELSDNDREIGARPVNQFPGYWYSTGPQNILKNNIDLGNTAVQISSSGGSEHFYILIKRDAARDNMWHSLMEIMAAQMSLDVLHLANDPVVNRPYFHSRDVSNSQVVILDDLPDGHFFDLWTLFARKPPLRLSQMVGSAELFPEGNIVIPLPGGANQFWQGDWEVLECTDSSLLKGFSKRVLEFYHISEHVKSANNPIVLTFVDRTTTRKLIDQDQSLALLREKYPQVQIDVVDYSLMSFAEQLAITKKTDILVGAHGAGLTHEMFLRPGSMVVEIMPVNFHYKGFHNVASMLGHKYFVQQAEDNAEKTGAKGDWQADDVYLKPTDFVALVSKAVESKVEKLRG